MMTIHIRTLVDGHYREVMHRFDRQLFEALLPPLANVEIKSFTGSKTGDIVHLQFHSPIKTEWISDITDHGEDEQTSFFVDEGTKLPFPLAYWRHKHIVQKVDDDHSCIIDEISYKASNRLLTWLIYPALYLSFYPRKKIYRRYFKKS